MIADEDRIRYDAETTLWVRHLERVLDDGLGVSHYVAYWTPARDRAMAYEPDEIAGVLDHLRDSHGGTYGPPRPLFHRLVM